MDISLLRSSIGKKLIWAGTDPETEKVYLLFEDMSALALGDEAVHIKDASTAMEIIVNGNLDLAKNIVSLQGILENGVKNGSEPGVLKSPDQKAIGATSGSGEDKVG